MTEARYLIDLTTSHEYRGRNAVGIVRTEREIGKAFFAADHDVDFFRFEKSTGVLLLISRADAADILGIESDHGRKLRKPLMISNSSASAPETASDEDFKHFLRSLQVRLDELPEQADAIASVQNNAPERLELYDGDVIISAGLLWDGNFLELIYALKQSTQIAMIQVIYDIVPVLIPEFCVPGMNIRFPRYLLDAAWTADALYCISDSTLNDVDKYLRKYELPMPVLHRIELGVDQTETHEGSSLVRNILKPSEFVLYVSTIEPRKNHAMLFHVWRMLFQSDRECLVPLVIVGRHGWNSTDLIQMMQAAEHLYPEFLRILTEVSDADLDWLYRNSCFTVYPSLYEGWGLPVAESLARGKFCITSDNSSIPEAAQGFAEMIDPLDTVAWTKSIGHYMRERDAVALHEDRIKREYRSLSWQTAMERFVISVTSTSVVSSRPNAVVTATAH